MVQVRLSGVRSNPFERTSSGRLRLPTVDGQSSDDRRGASTAQAIGAGAQQDGDEVESRCKGNGRMNASLESLGPQGP